MKNSGEKQLQFKKKKYRLRQIVNLQIAGMENRCRYDLTSVVHRKISYRAKKRIVSETIASILYQRVCRSQLYLKPSVDRFFGPAYIYYTVVCDILFITFYLIHENLEIV